MTYFTKLISYIFIYIFILSPLNAQTIELKKDSWSLYGAVEDIDTMDKFSQNCVSTVWSYNPNNAWMLYDTTGLSNNLYLDLQNIKKGQGFWVYAKDDCSIDFTQQLIVPTDSFTNGSYTLLAWNDLGMHCFDGADFSVFSILPPYNNLNAQLIKKDTLSNKHIVSGVSLTYESLENLGSINTSSNNKTNFWDYVTDLFPGISNLLDNIGLTGNKTPSQTPQPLKFNDSHNWWEADAIPIVNYDDNGVKNFYPMVRVAAKDGAGNLLATADVVLPVSDEMDCKKCHASDGYSEAKPQNGWEYDADELKDYKYNILKLHDDKHVIPSSDIQTLKLSDYDYNTSLYMTAKSGTPILCASCHKSNALATSGVGNATPLTSAIHSKHANVKDNGNGMVLNDIANRSSCYSCHPGATTECLRGAMGSAKDVSGEAMMQCQSCHGTMSDVGSSSREGWLDEPNCQVCHQNTQRYVSAFSGGALRTVTDTRFATNPNTPLDGVSLYRYSTGHGDLQCSSCHGSTHAIFPSSHSSDNIYSQNLQGHSGTISECTACHTSMPNTVDKGPHGMHTVGQTWIDDHEDVVETSGAVSCTACHGSDYKGTSLSATFKERIFNVEDYGVKSFSAKYQVGCFDCHDGPNGGDDDDD